MTPSVDEFLACQGCGALHAPDQDQCSECGRTIVIEPPTLPATQGQIRRERSARNRTIRNARNALFGLLALYWVNAIGLVIAASLMHYGGQSALTWVVTGMAAVAVTGALLLYRYPFPCTLGIAVVHTLGLVSAMGRGESSTPMMVMAAILWITVPLAKKTGDLIAEDEGVVDRLRGIHRTTSAPSRARGRAESRRFADLQVSNRSWIAAIIGVVATAAVGIGWYQFANKAVPPPPFAEPLARWEVAIESGDLASAKALCTLEYQERWPKVVKILERENWEQGVALGEAQMRRMGETIRGVHYDLPRGVLKTTWVVEDGAWRARRVVFSKVRAR